MVEISIDWNDITAAHLKTTGNGQFRSFGDAIQFSA